MPLDCEEKIDSDLVTDYVSPEKDVDGLVTSKIFWFLFIVFITKSFIMFFIL